jgi:rSAM/selenodomain-associated transferase 2
MMLKHHLPAPARRISIIIPALNEAEAISAAVRRAIEAEPHEVLVVDGGSSDGTAELARRAGATVLSTSPGRARQQNLGALRATGDVLLFLHADCWLPPDAMRQIESALADESVTCGAFRQQIEAEGVLYRWLESGNAWRARCRGLPYGDQGIFVRREAFAEAGGFPDVRLMEDLLLMKHMRRRRPVLLPGPIHVSARRWQRHGVVRQTLRNWSLLAAARLGVPPDRLAQFYARR